MNYLLLAPIFMLVAAAYSSVGLGGGTAYLAIVSFWNADPSIIRPIAWMLNVVVAGVAFYNYRSRGYFEPRIAAPYIIGGFAGAALGAVLPLKPLYFQILLSATLFGAAGQMLFGMSRPDSLGEIKPRPFVASLLLGFIIGVLSGLVGFGGGIVLGPILIALRWVDVKPVAAITSLYVALNSGSALAAFLVKGGPVDVLPLLVTGGLVLVGGFIGSRYGAGKASPVILKRIFGVIVIFAAIKLAYGAIVS